MPACVVCDEVITQPLCGACLAQQVATWLVERAVPATALRDLADVTEDILVRHGVTQCIKCGSPMGVCSYCYLVHVRSWLSLTLPELVPEFSSLFGFEPLQPPRDWASHPPGRRALVVEGSS